MHRVCRRSVRNFNPRSPCGERLIRYQPGVVQSEISIHAPRAGSDRNHFNPRSPCGERQAATPLKTVSIKISIHAPRAGSDGTLVAAILQLVLFQSTLPVRGATLCVATRLQRHANFNPRSPCGERQAEPTADMHIATFQSTLPVRGATVAFIKMQFGDKFQSTLPVRGATTRRSRQN